MSLTHFCIMCGREFQTDDLEATLCPEHAGEAPTPSSDQPDVTQGPVILLRDDLEVPQPSDQEPYRSEPSAAWFTIYSMRAFHDIPSLIRVLSNSTDIEMRRAAAWALGVLGDKRAIPLLRQAMQEPDDLLKFHSACALARLGDFQIMMQFLGEERPRLLPGMQLLDFEPWDWVKPYGRDAVEGVLNELERPLNFIFLRIGADFVIQFGDHALVSVLWKCLKHEDYRIRAVAAHKLGSLPEEASCERLILLLGDEVDVVGDRAADSLRMIGKAALPALKKVTDSAIRDRAQELIAQIEAMDN